MRPFNDGWLFTAPGAETEQAVTLPHAWNADGWSYANPSFPDPAGTGRYRRILGGEVRSGDVLKFEGVSARCRAFLDGKPVAENLGAYKSFEIRLDSVRAGSELVLEVTDKPSLELLPEGEDPEFVRSPRYTRLPVAFGSSLRAGGIWRDVHLVRRPAAYMARWDSGTASSLTEICGTQKSTFKSWSAAVSGVSELCHSSMLAGSGQGVEDAGLAAVGVARQRDAKFRLHSADSPRLSRIPAASSR